MQFGTVGVCDRGGKGGGGRGHRAAGVLLFPCRGRAQCQQQKGGVTPSRPFMHIPPTCAEWRYLYVCFSLSVHVKSHDRPCSTSQAWQPNVAPILASHLSMRQSSFSVPRFKGGKVLSHGCPHLHAGACGVQSRTPLTKLCMAQAGSTLGSPMSPHSWPHIPA